MKLIQVIPLQNYKLQLEFDNNTRGIVDISDYLNYEAFEPLKNQDEFLKVMNGGYYIEWDCGADLSIDTLTAKMKVL